MPKHIYIVYKITNTINDKIYIGITSANRLEKRWWAHQNCINKESRPLYNAMAKYGIDQFIITPICSTITREYLSELEKELIQEHNTMSPNGYNLTTGGEGGYKVSDETKEKLRQKKYGNTNRPPKQYTIEKPDGTRELITNMAKYCREHNLDNSNLLNTTKGRKHHHGYRVTHTV